MAYSLSFANHQSKDNTDALSSTNFVNGPNELMEQQLVNSQNQLRRTVEKDEWDDAPLPRTLDDALRPSNRAIVITETTVPFRIVDVNTAWEGLCGYSFVECQGKTLGSLLQGPETDRSAVTAVVSTLLRGEEAGAVLTNYTKDGRAFRNRLRVGPIMDGDHATHFVGVLQEIHDEQTKVMQH
jgi:PAS domain S-box-containing protein